MTSPDRILNPLAGTAPFRVLDAGGGSVNNHLRTALRLAAEGLPVLPLRKGKVPFANCPACL
jgi:hypothetical protein